MDSEKLSDIDLGPEIEGPRKPRRPLFQASYETQRLTAFLLEKHKEGAKVVTYHELSQEIGLSVRKEAYTNLLSARTRLERAHQIVTEVIPTVGLKFLVDTEKAHSSERFIRRSRTSMRRAGERLAAVTDFNALPPTEQTAVRTKQSMIGAVLLVTAPKAVKRIGEKVIQAAKTLPIGDTLRLFMRE